jgi:hypothetical protein
VSATNRGERGGGEHDFFPTPSWCTRRLIEQVSLPGGRWLEPGAGDGAIVRAVNRKDVLWTAVELREEARPHLLRSVTNGEVVITDFLRDYRSDRPFDVACGNPPFGAGDRLAREGGAGSRPSGLTRSRPTATGRASGSTRHRSRSP